MPPVRNRKDELSVEDGDNFFDSVNLDLRSWSVRILPKVRKISDEIGAAPLPTRVNVVANERLEASSVPWTQPSHLVEA